MNEVDKFEAINLMQQMRLQPKMLIPKGISGDEIAEAEKRIGLTFPESLRE